MALKPKFQEVEWVLYFQEVKCLKLFIKDELVKYFVYYSGWNKNWDEWVLGSRALKDMETNLQKRELQEASQEQYSEGKMRGAAPGKMFDLQERKILQSPRNGNGDSTSEVPPSASSEEKGPSSPCCWKDA